MHYMNLTAFIGVAIAMGVSAALYRQHLWANITRFGTATMALCVLISVVHLVEMLVRLDDPHQIGPFLSNGLLTTGYGAIVLFLCHGIHVAGLGASEDDIEAEGETTEES